MPANVSTRQETTSSNDLKIVEIGAYECDRTLSSEIDGEPVSEPLDQTGGPAA